MIDTHSHIHGTQYQDDIEQVLNRAVAAGVTCTALVGVNVDDTRTALDLTKKHPDTLCVIAGLHPHEASLWSADYAAKLRDVIAENRDHIVAVGEMGLDYHYDFAPKDAQKKAFEEQLALAQELDLPISIHCREAYDDCLAILRSFYKADDASAAAPSGVLHCYFGSVEQARESVDLGFMLGIGGASTFRNADQLHGVIAEIGIEHLVMETDAPYMAPIPYRGKRNEPAHLIHVRDRIAALKGMAAEAVDRQTSANARRLFRWPAADA